jgi:O-acetyl-ADP-ribose deacetylase (regulator of RNase III)
MRCGATEITIVSGDIAEQRCDALVNAANSALWMGSGVAGAIKRAAGPEVESEAVSQGPIEPGDAVSTGAGKLAENGVKRIIHAAAMGPDLVTNRELIASATKRTVQIARNENLDSVAMPIIGTGVGGFPLGEACDTIVEALCGVLSDGGGPAEFRLVAFDDRAYRAATLSFGKMFG